MHLKTSFYTGLSADATVCRGDNSSAKVCLNIQITHRTIHSNFDFWNKHLVNLENANIELFQQPSVL